MGINLAVLVTSVKTLLTSNVMSFSIVTSRGGSASRLVLLLQLSILSSRQSARRQAAPLTLVPHQAATRAMGGKADTKIDLARG